MENKIRGIIIGICLFLSIVVTILVLGSHVTSLDDGFYNLLMRLQSNFFDSYFKMITHLGNFSYIALIAGLIIVWSLIKKNTIKYYLLLTLFLTVVINQGLKFIIGRERPDLIQMIEASGYSYPSGHTMISISFFGLLIYLIYKSKLNSFVKWLVNGLLTIIMISVPISRIYLGVHFFTDIITGTLLSVCILLSVTYLMRRFENKK